MNVIIAFLKAHLKKMIWVQQSSRFEQKESNEIFLIYHLNMTLYELKQTSQEWCATLKVYLIFIDYQRVEIDYSMFIHDNDIIIIIYVNNLLILKSNIFNIQALNVRIQIYESQNSSKNKEQIWKLFFNAIIDFSDENLSLWEFLPSILRVSESIKSSSHIQLSTFHWW